MSVTSIEANWATWAFDRPTAASGRGDPDHHDHRRGPRGGGRPQPSTPRSSWSSPRPSRRPAPPPAELRRDRPPPSHPTCCPTSSISNAIGPRTTSSAAGWPRVRRRSARHRGRTDGRSGPARPDVDRAPGRGPPAVARVPPVVARRRTDLAPGRDRRARDGRRRRGRRRPAGRRHPAQVAERPRDRGVRTERAAGRRLTPDAATAARGAGGPAQAGRRAGRERGPRHGRSAGRRRASGSTRTGGRATSRPSSRSR